MGIDEDHQAWEAYPQHRWVFNKLDLALRMGYAAGPAGVPIPRDGKYIIKPIYNLYGMGLGAEVVEWTLADNKKIEDCEIISPGYMWCEYLEGPHYSVDYMRMAADPSLKDLVGWSPFCAMKGTNSESDLVKFTEWQCVEPPDLQLPSSIDNLHGVEYINLEMKGTQIFEVHLRSGNDHMWPYPIGTKLIPVWDEKEALDIPDEEFLGNITLPKIEAGGLTRYGFRVILNNS